MLYVRFNTLDKGPSVKNTCHKYIKRTRSHALSSLYSHDHNNTGSDYNLHTGLQDITWYNATSCMGYSGGAHIDSLVEDGHSHVAEAADTRRADPCQLTQIPAPPCLLLMPPPVQLQDSFIRCINTIIEHPRKYLVQTCIEFPDDESVVYAL